MPSRDAARGPVEHTLVRVGIGEAPHRTKVAFAHTHSRKSTSEASLRQRLQSLRDENHRLREENHSLKTELALAYGQQRDARSR